MPTLPVTMIRLLAPFVPLFSKRVWPHVEVLIAGAILTPGRRTVASALQVMGLGQEPQFQRYHRVLNRAVWSSLAVSRVLLGLLVATFVPTEPIVLGIDEALFGVAIGTVLSLVGSVGAALAGFAIGQQGGPFLSRLVSSEEHERADRLLSRWGVLAMRP